ncbi:MAG: hypothetical protein QXG65_03150 [Thermoplasmata archaeon]
MSHQRKRGPSGNGVRPTGPVGACPRPGPPLPPIGALTVSLLIVLSAIAMAPGAPSAGAVPSSAAVHSAVPVPPAPLSGGGTQTLGCDGVIWKPNITAWYSPSYCYGHDEPTLSSYSNAPSTGGNASYRIVLPASVPARSQGDLYATFWIGGVVYNASSLDSEAFFEMQFYPAAPSYTGTGSGLQDCLPNGAFDYNWTAGTNDWFVCTPVWGIISGAEINIASPAPLTQYGSNDSILVLHSGDLVYVNETARGPTDPWTFDVTDVTLHENGTIRLENGTVGIGPYYATASSSSTLSWGAASPGAISFAYEIGHALNASIAQNNFYGGCSPGQSTCYSYSPSAWNASGQMELTLPSLGPNGSAGYPRTIAFSSSQGGEAEVNSSSCGHPSFSPTKTCMYPYYIYRAGNYSFTFDASNVTNTTHNYGYVYQFPSTSAPRTVQAPWGSLNLTVSPADASVTIARPGLTVAAPLARGGTYQGEFMEGEYWVNATTPWGGHTEQTVYVGTGAVDRLTIDMPLPYSLTFRESGLPSGSPWSVRITGPVNQTVNGTGPILSASVSNGTYRWSAATAIAGYVPVPSNGSVDVAGVNGSVSVAFLPLYGVAVSASGLPATVRWTVSVKGPINATETGTGPRLTLRLTNGTYSFAVAAAGWQPSPATGTFTVSGPGGSFPVNFSQVVYPVTFRESGLPNGTWTVSVNGTAYTVAAGAPIAADLPNGTFSYAIGPISGWHEGTLPYNGTGTVDAAPVSEPTIVFTEEEYAVVFTETGLPTGTAWTVTATGIGVGGPIVRSATSTDASDMLLLPNGTYTVRASAPGYQAPNLTDVVSGTPLVARTVSFAPFLYPVQFRETGLPASTYWEVWLNSTRPGGPHILYGANQANLTLSAPNGSYVYRVTGTAGWIPISGGSGSIAVTGAAPPATAVVFGPFTYPVRFRETGLPAGTPWSIRFGGRVYPSTNGTIVVPMPNGTNAFAVLPVRNYTANVTQGSVVVDGAPTGVTIGFHPGTSPTPAPTILGLPAMIGYLLLAAIGVVVVAIAVGVAFAMRRRRGPPPRAG